MNQTDTSDVTFQSAVDQLSNRKSRREPTYDARIKADVIAFESDSGVPVATSRQNHLPLKITSRNGRSVVSGRNTKIPGEMNATTTPGEDSAKRIALERIIRERAMLMAAQNSHGKK